MGWFKMSDKTLAEQVATLEELKIKHLELQRLFDKVSLTCDQRGEEIGRLETERDSLRTSHRRVIRSLEEMKTERDKLKERLDLVRSVAAEKANDIPRTITADELREGQWFAYKDDESETWHTLEAGDEDFMRGFMKPGQPHTIVLLADAPEPEPEVTAETILKLEHGSTWENRVGDIFEWDGNKLRYQARDGRLYGNYFEPDLEKYAFPLSRSSAPPRGDYPKRLTVADLDAAEVGSVLRLGESMTNTKHEDGWGVARLSSSKTLPDWYRATLTPPEKPERRGEVIQPGELRVGDRVDGVTSKGNYSVRDMTITRIVDGVAHDDNKNWNFPHEGGWSEIRLVHRPEQDSVSSDDLAPMIEGHLTLDVEALKDADIGARLRFTRINGEMPILFEKEEGDHWIVTDGPEGVNTSSIVQECARQEWVLATLYPPEPERRGETLIRKDVRAGDILDAELQFGGWYEGLEVTHIKSGMIHIKNLDVSISIEGESAWCELRLVERPPMKPLPAEDGSVIQVTEVDYEPVDDPYYAALYNGGWLRIGSVDDPDEIDLLADNMITGFNPAVLSVEGGA